MTQGSSRGALLFVGDIFVFALSLALTLLVRYKSLSDTAIIYEHIAAFSFLFLIFVLLYYIFGLYGKAIILLKTRTPQLLLRAQVANVIIAAIFFFITPGLVIEPKGSLLIYLAFSLVLMFAWRLFVFPAITTTPSRMRTLLIGSGEEVDALHREICAHARYPFNFVHFISSPDTESLQKQVLEEYGIESIVADMTDSRVMRLITRWYTDRDKPIRLPVYSFVDVYEEVFDRVALSHVDYYAMLKRAQGAPLYFKLIKRTIDIVGGMILLLACGLTLPFVFIANMIEKNGKELFISQKRFGARGTLINVYKLRTMTRNDSASGMWVGDHTDNKVTRVGAFLRKTSIDEFPQALNILKGELSLIGPRTDIAGLGERLREELPHYDMRYLITPGITGWAQITQVYEEGHFSPQSVNESRMRLAYDFYYIQKRSLALDMVIALKTLKRLFSRTAS